MARYKVVPTKTNLLRLRRERSFAQEGYDLLEQKRQKSVFGNDEFDVRER